MVTKSTVEVILWCCERKTRATVEAVSSMVREQDSAQYTNVPMFYALAKTGCTHILLLFSASLYGY